MGWLKRFKKDESAISELSKLIFQASLKLAESLKPDLEKKFRKDSNEYSQKYIQIFFEIVYFYLHLTNRSALKQTGKERMGKLQDEVVPLTAITTIATVYKNCSQDVRKKIEDEFYQNNNKAELEYGQCKRWFLPPGEDDAFTRIACQKKSDGLLNRLIDNVAEIITGNFMNMDFSLPLLFIGIGDANIRKGFDALVMMAIRELK